MVENFQFWLHSLSIASMARRMRSASTGSISQNFRFCYQLCRAVKLRPLGQFQSPDHCGQALILIRSFPGSLGRSVHSGTSPEHQTLRRISGFSPKSTFTTHLIQLTVYSRFKALGCIYNNLQFTLQRKLQTRGSKHLLTEAMD